MLQLPRLEICFRAPVRWSHTAEAYFSPAVWALAQYPGVFWLSSAVYQGSRLFRGQDAAYFLQLECYPHVLVVERQTGETLFCGESWSSVRPVVCVLREGNLLYLPSENHFIVR